MTTSLATVDYWEGAACREPGVDPDLFFPGRGDRGEKARAICLRCPIRRKCEDWVMAFESQRGHQGHRYGMWAGLSPADRGKLARRERGIR